MTDWIGVVGSWVVQGISIGAGMLGDFFNIVGAVAYGVAVLAIVGATVWCILAGIEHIYTNRVIARPSGASGKLHLNDYLDLTKKR